LKTSTGLALVDLIFAGIDRVAKLKSLYTTSRAEGRDVTDAELGDLRAEDDQARAQLDELIATRRAGG